MLSSVQQTASEVQQPPLRVRKHAGQPCEGYHAETKLDGVEAKSTSELGCTYAATQLATAIQANHLGEFLGDQRPLFPLRPVWFRDPPTSLETTGRFLAECGFNALVVDSPLAEKAELKIIQKVSQISEASPYADYLLIELSPSSKELLESEAAEQQIRKWEEQLSGQGLIVYIKADNAEAAQRQAHWLPHLCDQCGERTILAFSALSGSATGVATPLHPIWARLREIPWPSATALMPVVNAGALNAGEGLWPISQAKEIDQILSQMRHHNFAGLLCLAGASPPSNGLAACNLWTAGQAQWQGRTASKLVDTWLRAHKPELNIESLKNLFEAAKQIIHNLSRLRSGSLVNEEARALAELVVSQLSYFSKQESDLSDYRRYFCGDAWCLLIDALNTLRLPLTPVLMHADSSGGFWTETTPGNRVTLRTTPQPRLDDPNMIRVFHENR